MSIKKKKLLILIPAFNEAETIKKTVLEIKANFQSIESLGIKPEILVIDDGSTDETSSIAKKAGADKVIENGRNIKLGATVWRGLVYARNAGYDILIKIELISKNENEFVIDHKLISKYFFELNDLKSGIYIDFKTYFSNFYDFCFEIPLNNMVREAINFKK